MAERVLVTGSSGQIGTALSERLLAEGFEVSGVDRKPNRWSETLDDRTYIADLCDLGAAESLPADMDMVIHLAARSRVPELLDNPSGARENVESTQTVLEYARSADVDVLFTSSREVYGDQGQIPVRESEARIRAPINPYGASKVAGEALTAAYSRCYGVRSATLRLSNVFGRYDASDRVVPSFIAHASRNKDLRVFGDDKVLDFIHIDDCVDAMFASIRAFGKVHGTVLNIGTGRGLSLVELAETVKTAVGSDSEVVLDPDRTGEVSRFVPAIDAIEQLLGWTPERTLETGVEQTVDWYLEHPSLLDDLA